MEKVVQAYSCMIWGGTEGTLKRGPACIDVYLYIPQLRRSSPWTTLLLSIRVQNFVVVPSQ